MTLRRACARVGTSTSCSLRRLLRPILIAAFAHTAPEVAAQIIEARGSVESPGQVVDGRDLPVREHVLDNGMRFLLLPREGPPTVSFVVHVAVGSVNESLGKTGASHLLEHLLFKGTTTVGTVDVEAELLLFEQMDAAHDSLVRVRGGRPEDGDRAARLEARIAALEDSARVHVIPNEYDRILARNGARGPNASTSYEDTQFFVSLPSNRAKLWFAIESDRMLRPVFREFFAERDVVLEERRTRTDTSPGGLLYAAHLATAFQVHPYGVPPVGHVEDLRALSRRDIEAHYHLYYGPEQTTVAVVGGFDPDSVVVWAEEYFGPVERRQAPPPLTAREPPQLGERRVEILYDAEPQIRIGWKVPSSLDGEAPALAILADILVAGGDSRLYRRLVRDERIASSVVAGTGPGRLYPGLFTIHAVPAAPHDPEEVEAVIYEELDRLLREPPSDYEIERVRTRLEASAVRRLTSNEGLAFQLVSSSSAWGDWRETFRLQERLGAVQSADVVRVVNRYLTREARTVAILRRAEP